MNSVKMVTCVCVGLLAAMTPRARADAWDQKTIFTFSAPVELPGQVLQPGTYVFKIAESQVNRNTVEVFNKDQQHLYGMFNTIPDYHLRPASRAIITFEERAAGAPPAVKTWFYPGDNYGHEFVYKKAEMVASTAMPTATMAAVTQTETAEAAPAPAPAPAPLAQPEESTQQQTEQRTEIAQATPPPAEAAPAPAPAPQQSAPPQNLPHTGSSMPLIGLIGLASLASAGLLHRVSRRSES